MSYYFSTIVNDSFSNAIQKVTDALKTEGFGILTEIDMKATLKKKIRCGYCTIHHIGCL